MPRPRQPLTIRFWDRVADSVESECWVWTGCTTYHGYGRLAGGPESRTHLGAHRVSYELHVGEIPDNHHAHHVCGNKGCVNPEHLVVISEEEHGRLSQLLTPRKTHCPQGHPYDEKNTYVMPSGGTRRCRVCLSEQQARYGRNRRARLRDAA